MVTAAPQVEPTPIGLEDGAAAPACELCGLEGAVLGERLVWQDGGYVWVPALLCADEDECLARVSEQQAPEPRWQVQ